MITTLGTVRSRATGRRSAWSFCAQVHFRPRCASRRPGTTDSASPSKRLEPIRVPTRRVRATGGVGKRAAVAERHGEPTGKRAEQSIGDRDSSATPTSGRQPIAPRSSRAKDGFPFPGDRRRSSARPALRSSSAGLPLTGTSFDREGRHGGDPPRLPEVLERFHSHLDLVDLVARQLARELGRSAELDDLRSMGHQGLLEAARRFDEGRGVTFRRFANYRVRGAMLDGVRKSAPLPRRAHARVRALEAALLLSEAAAEDAARGSAPASPTPRDASKSSPSTSPTWRPRWPWGSSRPRSIGDEGEPSALDTSASPEEAVAEAELRRISS